MNSRKPFHVTVILLVMLILGLIVTGPTSGNCEAAKKNALRKVKTFEGGAAYKTSDGFYWVLNLTGTWREMGRQYGGLVRQELRLFYQEITADVADRGISRAEQLETAKEFGGSFNANLRELMKGIAESSGLNEDEVLVLNVGMVNLADAILGPVAPSACSGIAVWNHYTPDGRLVFGRNWDIDRAGMKKYMKFLSVVVFNPDSGNSFANIHPLGNVYLETGINNKGLFMEINNGVYSDTNIFEDRENSVSVMVSAINQCNTMDEAVKYLADAPADMAYIIQAADAKEAVSVERPTFGCRVRQGEPNGVLVAYNSFVPPYPKEWMGKVAEPRNPKEDPRYLNLISLANSGEFYGKLNPEKMKELMNIQIQDGGATHHGTVLQVIAVPEDLTLWMRGLDYADWQQIDLKDLFKKKSQ